MTLDCLWIHDLNTRVRLFQDMSVLAAFGIFPYERIATSEDIFLDRPVRPGENNFCP